MENTSAAQLSHHQEVQKKDNYLVGGNQHSSLVFKLPPRGCPACTRSARNPRVHAASVETTSQASQTVGAGKQTQVSIFFETPWKQSVLHGSISGAPWKVSNLFPISGDHALA
eukprot:1159006-Pelagomonas_calceolata.AAC.1